MLVDAIFFDFANAFDTISHDILVSRLYACGVSGTLLKWFANFLSNRKQMVRIGNASSTLLPVTSGVIQGSVLGPTLFNIFINDIDSCIKHGSILKYADDIRLFSSCPKTDIAMNALRENLQSDIDSIFQWISNSKMKLNEDKCFYTTFGCSTQLSPYNINGSNLTRKDRFKDLGLLVSSPLSFNTHMDLIVGKAYSRLGLINKLFKTKTPKSVPRLYKAFVRPILEYSSLIWNPYTVKYITKIERVQRNMCRMIPTIRYLPYRQQLLSLGLHSLQLRRQRYQLITIFKFFQHLTNFDPYDLFQIAINKRTRGHKLTIIPGFSRNNYRLHFFTNSSIELWNKLTDDDVNTDNLSHFKKRLENFFNSIDLW
jgi:hypothetical protein